MRLTRFLVVLGLAYVAYACVMYAEQRRLLFPIAGEHRHAYAGPVPSGARLLQLPASYGRVRALFLPAPSARAAPAVLFTHGNAEVLEDLADSMSAVRALGVNVLLLEYPGYDGADGAPSQASIDEAATAAYDWLARQPQVDARAIVAMGVSVGGAPAAELTRLRPVRALVLLSTFTAVRGFAADYGLPGFLVRDDFDSAERVRDFAGPVFVAHGRADPVIPFAQGEALAKAARHGEFHAFDCGHVDCPYRGAAFASLLGRFLAAQGLLPPAAALAHAGEAAPRTAAR
jgi:fermentation-respiration switch protein FrsA (DUF1100 family)